ncbi:MAG: alpha-amylase family protein [Terriglobia bacterium]
MRHSKALILSLLFLAPAILCAQVGSERGMPRQVGAAYPAEWPQGPGPDSLPVWAREGGIRIARWDGGRIEAAKAMLSGWPGFNPPIPDNVYTMSNWYDPQTIHLLRDAGINVAWVTFSNGFSIPTEEKHREQLRRYIAECHRQGIHVIAYESVANVFWEDMFEQVPESRDWVQKDSDGKPVPYGSGDYTKMGRVTRYMADLGNPQWRDYLKKRVDLAIDAGADALMYDNNFGGHLVDLYQDIYRYGAARKKDFMIMGNFHQNSYVLNRLTNCMTTEDGAEPGVYDEAHIEGRRGRLDAKALVPVDHGLLVNNMGLFRIWNALSQGWKPMLVEDGGREVGVRETTPMSPERQQLALAEATSFGVGLEVFVEGAFARGLFEHDPGSMAIWRAIGTYNRFFSQHREYYAGTKSLASVAVVLDDRSESVSLLDGLAARHVLFDVIYESDLTAEKLAPYKVVALLTARTVRQRALSALETYVTNGGRIIAAGDAATLDENGQKHVPPGWFGKQAGKGECTYYEQLPPLDDLSKTLRDAAGPELVHVEVPPGVLYNIVQQPATGSVMIHFLNYTLKPSAEIRVGPQQKFATMAVYSPDSSQPLVLIGPPGLDLVMKIPSVHIYSMLVMLPRGNYPPKWPASTKPNF